MLFRQPFLDQIRDGAVTIAFRRWRRPTVRAGGTLLTPVGQLPIISVDRISLNQITADEVRRAGFAWRADLVAHRGGDVSDCLGPVQADPRVALRQVVLDTDSAHVELRHQLRRLDESSSGGSWTMATLRLLAEAPGVRAGDLADRLAQDRDRFKQNVRHLKRLGLTESLPVGYRLSARGQAFLQALQADDTGV